MAPPTHLHVYSLPTELLDSLVPRIIGAQPTDNEPEEPEVATEAAPEQRTRACNVCPGAAFTDVNDQRAHYRADWHRYNVKSRLQGGTPVSEADFGKLVDGLEDSLSGSASSDTHSSDSDSDAVRDLLQKTKISRSRAREDDEDDTPRTQQSPLAWFHTPGPPPTQLGVYRVLFPPDTAPSEYLDELKALQSPVERKWAMFMTAGGHFAGAIVRVSNGEDDPEEDDGEEDGKRRKKQKKLKQRPETEMVLHKTFHRYTTRRKQGGSQGLNDAAGKKAISAGAMLRRYGEQALRDDIRGLLTEWADEIAGCERVFIRASVSNRRIFLDYDGSVLSKTDNRLRTFPFPTRRPTQAELARCLLELTRVKTSHLTEDALRAQDEAYLATLPKPKAAPTAPAPAKEKEKVKAPKLSPEEEALRAKWSRATDMLERGKLDALKGFWEKEGAGLGGPDARIVSGDEKENGRTLLAFAARIGQVDIVAWLLEEAGADPTVPVVYPQIQTGDGTVAPVGKSRTAYDEASTKEVRDAFRRAAGSAPERWDWLGAAHVPSAYNQAKEDEKEAKQKARRKGLRDKLRERESTKTPEPEAISPPPKPEPILDSGSGPRKLGGASGGEAGLAGLTPEMRLKVERERRARAVEARMKAMSGK